MATGLIALLDDVAALAKVAAASIDDVAAQAAKAGTKAMGVVVDDAAVTPRYVVGFAAARELPIVWRIAKGSLKNKLLFLLPGALLLSLFAPWLITPLLMLGGIYLCYEGAEKLLHAIRPHAAEEHEKVIGVASQDPLVLEEVRVASAIKTDFILSAEIMALTLATMPQSSTMMQAAVLAVVGVGITFLVYGAVALIVKADDAGVAMAATGRPLIATAGRALVLGMPHLLKILAAVGTAAMLWVGGGIILHGLEEFGVTAPAHMVHGLAHAAGDGFTGWVVSATLAGLFGLVVGAVAIPLASWVVVPSWRAATGLLGGSR